MNAFAESFLRRRLGGPVLEWIRRLAAQPDSWLCKPPRLAPAVTKRVRGQHATDAALGNLVMLVDDADVLGIGRPFSALEVAMLSLVGGHRPPRAVERVACDSREVAELSRGKQPGTMRQPIHSLWCSCSAEDRERFGVDPDVAERTCASCSCKQR